MENYGIRDTPLSLLQSYLTNRQLTKFNGAKSDLITSLYGVPQGSVFGPLLFILYINYIINCSKLGHFVMFADDTNIFVTEKSENEAYRNANRVLIDLNLYMLSNQMMKEKGVLEQRLWEVIIKSLYLTIKSKKLKLGWSS